MNSLKQALLKTNIFTPSQVLVKWYTHTYVAIAQALYFLKLPNIATLRELLPSSKINITVLQLFYAFKEIILGLFWEGFSSHNPAQHKRQTYLMDEPCYLKQ